MSLISRAKLPVPIFNTPHFADVLGLDSGSLSTDQQGLFRPLEMIALPGSTFEIRSEGSNFYEIFFPSYCSKRNYFVFKAGIEPARAHAGRMLAFSSQAIEARLISQMGRPYLWGGNFPEPLEYMLEAFPALAEIGGFDGIDCSGLMYWASGGVTPRNVSGLHTFGKEIPRDRWHPKPLDVIVWEDHVVFALSNGNVIESKEKFGVYQTPLVSRVRGLLQSERAFVIRRGDFS